MKKRFIMTVILCFSFLLQSGCWSRRELNDIAIALALGIDKSGDQYSISVQIVNPGEVAAKTGTGKGSIVLTQTEKGETLAEALRRITTKTPRKIHLAHLRIVVFGEEIAKEGIGKTLDFLSRNHEVRADFAVLVAKGLQAEKILRVYTVPQEPIPANKIFKSLETSDKVWAVTAIVTLDELISDIANEGKYPTLTGIELLGDIDSEAGETRENVERMKPIVVLRTANLAVFKKDKLVGWLSETESKGYNYIRGNVKGSVGQVACPNGGKLSLEVIRTKAEMHGKVIDGQPQVDIQLRIEENVGDVQCEIDLTKPETISLLESKAEERVKGILEGSIKKVQTKYKSDIFGFGDAIRRSDPAAWNTLKQDWDEKFPDVKVNVNVTVEIRRLGTVTDTVDTK
jgi:spore germination protein KC